MKTREDYYMPKAVVLHIIMAKAVFLRGEGKKEIAIYSPSFVADCLETTDELGHELVNDAKEWGGNIYPIECLNTNNEWCKDFAKYTFTQAEGSAQDKDDIEYQLTSADYDEMKPQKMKSDD